VEGFNFKHEIKYENKNQQRSTSVNERIQQQIPAET
jgi:hypothetical protein